MDVVFIPSEYAARGAVIGHPETVAAIKAEVDRLRTPLLRCGPYTVSTMPCGSVWLQKVGEEGMEISLESMEEELQRIFEARF